MVTLQTDALQEPFISATQPTLEMTTAGDIATDVWDHIHALYANQFSEAAVVTTNGIAPEREGMAEVKNNALPGTDHSTPFVKGTNCFKGLRQAERLIPANATDAPMSCKKLRRLTSPPSNSDAP